MAVAPGGRSASVTEPADSRCRKPVAPDGWRADTGQMGAAGGQPRLRLAGRIRELLDAEVRECGAIGRSCGAGAWCGGDRSEQAGAGRLRQASAPNSMCCGEPVCTSARHPHGSRRCPVWCTRGGGGQTKRLARNWGLGGELGSLRRHCVMHAPTASVACCSLSNMVINRPADRGRLFDGVATGYACVDDGRFGPRQPLCGAAASNGG